MSLPSPSIASSNATLVPSSSSIRRGGGGGLIRSATGSIGGPGAGVCQDDQQMMINVQIYVPEYNVQKCIQAGLDDSVWDVKQKILALMPKDMQEGFNYGLFLPPCSGRAGKFLLEERPLRDYPFKDCVPYLELKYKKRVYKMLNLDEKALKHLHTKSTLKKFLEYVEQRQAEKLEKLCSQGLDPNFHDSNGETPLTLASSLDENKACILALTSGGAHLDFRNSEGQTPLHKAAFLATHENVKTLLELGASPNYKDPLGLTPLYYCMLKAGTNGDTAELLLRDYADVGTTDPHGNQEVHQACKNDLVTHLEHLLFYGAEINCRNVNGNTPLHVCAVNDQQACARVLLFRGADPNLVNNQGQTPFHVAVITGHHAVAELIRTHDPNTAVPYRGMPRYNSKRRLAGRRSPAGSVVSRTRSLNGSIASFSSECGGGGGGYGTIRASDRSSVPPPAQPQQQHQHYGVPFTMEAPGYAQHHNHSHNSSQAIVAAPPHAFSGSRTMMPEYRSTVLQNIKKSISEQNAVGHFATVRGSLDRAPGNRSVQRVTSDLAAASMMMSTDVNIPRILVIPRGPKGFGFILRGAKKVDSHVNFEPTPEIPALQYFEGVDMNGMAMKAGLKPGDFLLEINGVDVRCASHDQVVRLIQVSGETISLKVITIDPSEPLPPPSVYGTIRRNSKAAPTQPIGPPAPPARHPSTSLSNATGRSAMVATDRCDDDEYGGIRNHHQQQYPRPAVHHHHHATVSGGMGLVEYRDPVSSMDKVASVRGRANSRRISAAELEQLMARQNSVGAGSSCSSTSYANNSIDSPDSSTSSSSYSYRNSSVSASAESASASASGAAGHYGGPKVYNSVAEMKRQRREKMHPHPHPVPHPHHTHSPRGSIVLVDAGFGGGSSSLKSFHSSPDLKGSVLSLAARNYCGADEDEDQERRQHYYSASHQQQQLRSAEYGTLTTGGRGGKVILRPKTPPPAPPVDRTRMMAGANGNPHPHPVPPPPPQPAPVAPLAQHHSTGGSTYAGGAGGHPHPHPVPHPEYDHHHRIYQRHHQRGVGDYGSLTAPAPHIPEPDYDDPIPAPTPNHSNHRQTVTAVTTINRESGGSGSGAPPPAPPPPPPPLVQAPCTDLKSALMLKRQHIMNNSKSNGSGSASASAFAVADLQKPPAAKILNEDNSSGVAAGGKADFNLDLRSAIAKRRNRLDKLQEGDSAETKNAECSGSGSGLVNNQPADCRRVVGLSLRESVQNNIQLEGKEGNRKPENGTGTSASASIAGGKLMNGGGATKTSGNSPNGFAHKKDSGFSSSRNSLEPSECGECGEPATTGGTGASMVMVGGGKEATGAGRPSAVLLVNNEDMLRQHRVSVLSNQLEENMGGGGPESRTRPSFPSSHSHQQHDAISLSSTLSTLSGCSDATGSSALSRTAAAASGQSTSNRMIVPPMPRGAPPLPPPDYDPAADSGTGDSENDENDVTPNLSQQNLAAHRQTNPAVFRSKSLSDWSVADVCDWLDSLYLSEYKRGFCRAEVDGGRLADCDRTRFTQLGVTRIAHRIAMENSLKQYKAAAENNSLLHL